MNRVVFPKSPFLINWCKNYNLKNTIESFKNNNSTIFFLNNSRSLTNNKSTNLFVSQQQKNLTQKTNFNLYSSRFNSTNASNTVVNQTGSISIFKRFKEAYKQHGKILIWCHFISCWGWVIGFFFLAKALV